MMPSVGGMRENINCTYKLMSASDNPLAGFQQLHVGQRFDSM